MSAPPGGQGGFHQNQQNYAYNDGRTSIQYQVQQTTWSTSSQQSMPVAMSPHPQIAQQVLPMQQILPTSDIHQQQMHLANQIHAQGMQHHAAVMQSMQQSMHQAFQSVQQPLPAPQPMFQLPAPHPIYQPPAPQPQTQYVQPPAPVQYQQTPYTAPPPQQQQRLQIPTQGHVSESESSSDEDEDREEERKRQLEQMEKRVVDRLSAPTEAARKELQNLRAELHRLAETGRQSATKDQRIAQLMQEQAENEKRHSRELAELHKAQSQSQPPSLNMSTMRNAIQEAVKDIKASSLSESDVRDMVHNAVGERTAGVATTKDLESAARLVRKELEKMTSKSSDNQIRSVMREELEDLRRRITESHSTQQQTIEAPATQMAKQERSQVQTTFDVTDLSETATYPQLAPASAPASSHGLSSRKSKALPAIEETAEVHHQGPSLTSGALARVEAQARSGSSKSSKMKSRASVAPTSDNAMTRMQHATPPPPHLPEHRTTPLSHAALAGLPPPQGGMTRSEHSKSKASAQPSAETTVARVKHSRAADPGMPQQASMQLTEGALARPPAPDDIASRSKNKPSKSVQPTYDNALVSAQHFAAPMLDTSQQAGMPLTENSLARVPSVKTSSSRSKSSKTRMSVQPSDDNAVVRGDRSGSSASVLNNQQVETASSNSALARVQHTENMNVKSSKKSTVSAQPPAMVDQNTVARRPRNDRRDESVSSRPSGLKQVAYPKPDQRLDGQKLGDQSRDLVRKARR